MSSVWHPKAQLAAAQSPKSSGQMLSEKISVQHLLNPPHTSTPLQAYLQDYFFSEEFRKKSSPANNIVYKKM